jgi:isopentenyl diphosphate isomerase/L-lactate dehydrogenase-like FMN-dependent dehydrogenase
MQLAFVWKCLTTWTINGSRRSTWIQRSTEQVNGGRTGVHTAWEKHPQRLQFQTQAEAVDRCGGTPASCLDFGIPRHGGAPVLDNWLPYAPKGANAADVAEFFSAQVPPASQTWQELETYRRLWPGTLVVKGIMRTDDAERATELGVDGILISNHGGRQLDRAPAPMDVFPMPRSEKSYADGG